MCSELFHIGDDPIDNTAFCLLKNKQTNKKDLVPDWLNFDKFLSDFSFLFSFHLHLFFLSFFLSPTNH